MRSATVIVTLHDLVLPSAAVTTYETGEVKLFAVVALTCATEAIAMDEPVWVNVATKAVTFVDASGLSVPGTVFRTNTNEAGKLESILVRPVSRMEDNSNESKSSRPVRSTRK